MPVRREPISARTCRYIASIVAESSPRRQRISRRCGATISSLFCSACSFTFETALARAGIPLRHQEENKVVPMYITNRDCVAAGAFRGPLVVSMRPIEQSQVPRVVEITSKYPDAHGAPVQSGRPEALGIRDVDNVDYGDAVTIHDGEIPVFWACGVTPQAVAVQARPELLITHAPGRMFITDLENVCATDNV